MSMNRKIIRIFSDNSIALIFVIAFIILLSIAALNMAIGREAEVDYYANRAFVAFIIATVLEIVQLSLRYGVMDTKIVADK